MTAGLHTVYVHRSAAGRVLYVGCTKNLKARTAVHKSARECESLWWPYVATVEIDSLWPDRKKALDREKALIGELHPPGNRQHNPTGSYGDRNDCAAIARLLGVSETAALMHVLKDGRASVSIYAELMFSDARSLVREEVPA